MRIDQLLVQRQLACTRSQAQRLIAGGVQWHCGGPWRVVTKNGDDVPTEACIQLQDTAEARYVSRGGLKLAGALQHTGLSVQGFVCLDVGQSTGGFTDCLLQSGAARVVGVDVGRAQLHPRLRSDPRVVCIENCNARTLIATDLIAADARSTGTDGLFDLIVCDLSFISQTHVLPALVSLLERSGVLLSLVKPQFELQPGQVGKRGIVRDPSLYGQVEKRLRSACAGLGLQVTHWFESPITGGDGNHEFFMVARFGF